MMLWPNSQSRSHIGRKLLQLVKRAACGVSAVLLIASCQVFSNLSHNQEEQRESGGEPTSPPTAHWGGLAPKGQQAPKPLVGPTPTIARAPTPPRGGQAVCANQAQQLWWGVCHPPPKSSQRQYEPNWRGKAKTPHGVP